MDKPLQNSPDREQRVRERAYHLWETEGKPHGRDIEHWGRACELIATEERASAVPLPDPPGHPDPTITGRIEAADVGVDTGESSGRLADKEDAQPAPARRRSPTPKRATPTSRAKKPRKK